MHKISVAEAYESGFTIGDLEELLQERFEELYEDPSPQETIRRIAISQDTWSFEQTRRWLKSQLLVRKPWRKYIADFDAIIDSTLIAFYSGERMSHITSMAQARMLSEADSSLRIQIAAAAEEIAVELIGITYAELPGFLQIIAPKYEDNWKPEDFEMVLIKAVEQHAQRPEFVASKAETTQPPTWIQFFAVRDHLEQLLSTAPAPMYAPIPDVMDMGISKAQQPVVAQVPTPVFKEESVKLYDWSKHENSFETPGGLKVGLVKITESKELLLEIGHKNDVQCNRFVLHNGKFVGVGDKEQILEVLKTEANVKLMVGFIIKKFLGVAL